jgi:hypothetical protein
VERDDAIGAALRARGGMVAGIADGKPVEHEPGRPDRGQALEQRGKHGRCCNTALLGDAEKIIDQIARPRRRAPEHVRAFGQRRAETAQQHAALFQADQRIFAVDLKMARQRRGIDARKRGMIDAEGMGGIGREQPRGEHVEAGDGKPLRAREEVASLAVVITPGIAGSGVEQHADGCQVDGDAGAFERGASIRAASSLQRSTPPAEKCRQRL